MTTDKPKDIDKPESGAKCPYCEEGLSYVLNLCHEIITYEFRPTKGSEQNEYCEVDREPEMGKEPEYQCPECEAFLTLDEEEVRDFLLGKKPLPKRG